MEIIEGLIIINEYVEDKSFCAEHDQIWFGNYDQSTEKMPKALIEKLLNEGNWFEDENSWSHFC